MLKKIITKINTYSIEKKAPDNKIIKYILSCFSVSYSIYKTINIVHATDEELPPYWFLNDMFDQFELNLKELYGFIISISTACAITWLSICLMIRMLSHNLRAVEEATAWIKRIITSWLILNSLGYLLAYGKELVRGAPSLDGLWGNSPYD